MGVDGEAITSWAPAPVVNVIALAGTYSTGKILRSTNNGANWTDLGQQASQAMIILGLSALQPAP
jgi:hypothetical protein